MTSIKKRQLKAEGKLSQFAKFDACSQMSQADDLLVNNMIQRTSKKSAIVSNKPSWVSGGQSVNDSTAFKMNLKAAQ